MRRSGIGGAILAGTALAATAVRPVAAAPVTFSGSPSQQIVLVGGLGTQWTISNTLGTSGGTPAGSCLNGAGLGVLDGLLSPNGTPKSDPFDDGLTVWIDDVRYVSPDGVDVTGSTLTSGPVTMSGLDVSVQYAPVATSAALRMLVSLHNPGVQPSSATVKAISNFGSDGATQVIGTSSGDTTIDADDHWTVTSDSLTTPMDAVNVQVFAGPRSVAEPDVGYGVAAPDLVDPTAFPCFGTQGLTARYPVTVPPGTTVHLLLFHELAANDAEGLAEAPTFDGDVAAGDPLLAGLTDDQLQHVVNWNLFGVIDLAGGGGGSGTVWSVWNSAGTDDGTATGTCEAAPGFAVGDVQYDPGIPEHLAKHDAFDNALVLFVDGAPFVSPFAPSHTATAVTAGPVVLSGLNVTAEYTALAASPTLRGRFRFTNPSGVPITVDARVATNFGSNGNNIVASSDGNASIDAGDRWIVSSDDLTTPVRPVATAAILGPGAPPLPPSAVSGTTFACHGTQGLDAVFHLTVPAGESRALLFFNEAHATNQDAVAAATAFDTTPAVGAALVTGLDASALAEVANWNFCGATAACDDGNACTTDGCGAQGGCIHAAVTTGASFAAIGCRLGDLVATAQAAAGKPAAAIVRAVQSAKAAVDRASSLSSRPKKGPAKAQLAKAIRALKQFEALLAKKGVKAGLAQPTVDAARTASAGVRTDLGTLKGRL